MMMNDTRSQLFTLFSPQSRALLWFPGHWPQSDKAHYEEHLDRRNMCSVYNALVSQNFYHKPARLTVSTRLTSVSVMQFMSPVMCLNITTYQTSCVEYKQIFKIKILFCVKKTLELSKLFKLTLSEMFKSKSNLISPNQLNLKSLSEMQSKFIDLVYLPVFLGNINHIHQIKYTKLYVLGHMFET